MALFWWSLLILLAAMPAVRAQQKVDDTFRFQNRAPAYARDRGPRVCIDAAHDNFHTAEGGYRPFAALLAGDGYRVRGSTEKFSERSLSACDLLVVVNATAEENREHWGLPHPSAFTRAEINSLHAWIRRGGALFLIADHDPWVGAAADLALALGLVLLNAEARDTETAEVFDRFTRAAGQLADHPITRGRNGAERIDGVATFVGHAFLADAAFQPLLRFGPHARATVILGRNVRQLPVGEWPTFSVAGWLHAAARRLDRGRLVVLGEAAACTAQLVPGIPGMGMNHPGAAQNAQFCLNAVRWLSGALDPGR